MHKLNGAVKELYIIPVGNPDAVNDDDIVAGCFAAKKITTEPDERPAKKSDNGNGENDMPVLA